MSEPLLLDWAYTGLPDGVGLNPLQALVNPIKDTFDNKVIAAPTASGKTVCAVMCGYKHIMRFKKVLYIGIMKALVEEKRADWEDADHPWGELKHATVTGDFKFTDEQFEECMAADVIVATPEALTARMQVKKNRAWLRQVGLVIFDELHLVGAEGRGAPYEACAIQLNTLVPKVENLGLSATIPNAEDFRLWLEALNDKPTHLICSDYRPVPLEKTFIKYNGFTAEQTEEERLGHIIELIESKSTEQFMVCVWKKSFGRKIEQELVDRGVSAQFHNADLDRSARRTIEKNFREGRTRVIINTSTLTTGVNLPATNVIVTAVKAGSGDIPGYEIQQAAGRAGRPQYDTRGYNYFLVPYKDAAYHVARILNGENIQSQFLFPSVILLALLIELYTKRIDGDATFESWYRKSLANQQSPKTSAQVGEMFRGMVEDLTTYGCLSRAKELEVTKRGNIVAQMQLDPVGFGVMIKNVEQLSALARRTDIAWCVALSDNPLFKCWIGNYEKRFVPDIIQRNIVEDYWKSATCMYARMQSEKPPAVFASENYKVWETMSRYGAALSRVKNEAKTFKDIPGEEIARISLRIIRACSDERASLYMSQFTTAEQRKLNRLGLYSIDDCRGEPKLAAHALSVSRMKELKIVRTSV